MQTHIDDTAAAYPIGREGPRRPPGPRAGWRQVGRDLMYLLPGLPIAIASFTALVVGFSLGIGLIVLALIGLLVLLFTLIAARGFATAERGRVGVMEGRRVGPVYYRTGSGSGLSRIVGYLRDPQLWRDFLHGVLILPVRVVTWSLTIIWVACALTVTYGLWAWSIPRGDETQGLADLVFGWDSLYADIMMNTAFGVVFAVTLPYAVRSLASVEASLAWTILTSEDAAWRARAADLARSRQAVVQAEADTLRKVERDIHDGPQQRLVRLTMDLQSAQRRLSDDPEAAGPLVEGALQQTQEALTELRALSRGIAPPILTDRGLAAALAAAAARCPVSTTVNVDLEPGQRLAPSVENAAYFVVAEALTNVAKHSGAHGCEVSVGLDDDGAGEVGAGYGAWDTGNDDHGAHRRVLRVQVRDDGRGGTHIGKGHGLAGLTDRLAGVDGTLHVDSPPGGGTLLSATIPLP